MDGQFEILKPYCENDMKRLKKLAQSVFMRFNEKLAYADYDDFYSIANMVLWQCYNTYNSDMGVSFEGYLFSCLQKKFKTELTRRHRQKRVNDLFNVSLDALVDNEEGCTLINIIPSEIDTFEEVLKRQGSREYQSKVQQYIARLSTQQINILNLLMDGYKPMEIREILQITPKEYTDNLQFMRAYENVKILF